MTSDRITILAILLTNIALSDRMNQREFGKEECAGAVKIIACIQDPNVIGRILHLLSVRTNRTLPLTLLE